MEVNVGDTVFPGDTLKSITTLKNVVVLGPGLRRKEDEPNSLSVTRPGTLCFRIPNFYWVEGRQRRYIPKKGDLVVGVITKKSGDNLKVDIGSSEAASLSLYSFEGATKKQKPDLQIGDAVFARLLTAHKEMEPELVCVDSYSKAGKLGVLPNNGFIMSVGLELVHRLLNVDSLLFRTLGKKFPYEIAVGMNGKVWINANDVKHVLTLVRALEAAQHQNDIYITEICKQFK